MASTEIQIASARRFNTANGKLGVGALKALVIGSMVGSAAYRRTWLLAQALLPS